MLLLLDNYDSFTYNVYQLLCELGAEVEVIRNDQITVRSFSARIPPKTNVKNLKLNLADFQQCGKRCYDFVLIPGLWRFCDPLAFCGQGA